jgi:hypothetical protein
MSNCLNAAKALDGLMLELIGKGIEIPLHVADNLKSGRTFARLASLQREDEESGTKARIALENVEMNLLALAEINLGAHAAETWQQKIRSAYQEETAAGVAPVSAPMFGSGVPKGDHWVRLQSDYLDTVEGAEKLLEGFAVSVIKQVDGYLLIHGRKEGVSAFMKELRQKAGKVGKNAKDR